MIELLSPEDARRDAGLPFANSQHLTALVDYLRQMVCVEPSLERFHAVFLDSRHQYLSDIAMGTGQTGALHLRMRELFAHALQYRASGLIIAHNHPSGVCRPSHRDVTETRRLSKVALALDIELIDHLIITHDLAYSMRIGGDL